MASAGRDDELPRRWHGTQEARDPAQVAASEHRPHGDQGSPGGHLRTGLQLGSGTELGERPVGRPGGRWTGAEDEARPSRTWQGWGGGVPRRVEGARITTKEDHTSGQPVRCRHEWRRWFT